MRSDPEYHLCPSDQAPPSAHQEPGPWDALPELRQSLLFVSVRPRAQMEKIYNIFLLTLPVSMPPAHAFHTLLCSVPDSSDQNTHLSVHRSRTTGTPDTEIPVRPDYGVHAYHTHFGKCFLHYNIMHHLLPLPGRSDVGSVSTFLIQYARLSPQILHVGFPDKCL